MTDILGPGSNASNVVTSRPGDTRLLSTIDTWLKDCTSPAASDGTAISASFLNGLLAQLRVAIRGNGQLVTGGPVIPENDSDPMLLNALLHLVQRGKMHFASDTGGVNALVAEMTPVPPELVDGMLVVMRPASRNNGASTLALNGKNPIVSASGAALGGGELLPPLFSVFRWNAALTSWQLSAATPPQAALFHFGVDTSPVANTIVAQVSPLISAYQAGMFFATPIANPNTGPTQIDLDALGLKNIVANNNGLPLSGGEMSNVGGYVPLILYDANGNARLINPLPKGVSKITPFTASGSFVPSSSLVLALAWASGAAGRNAVGSSFTAPTGGGAGEFRFGFFQVTPNVAIPITVPPATASGSNGNGAPASFGSLMTAMGAVGPAAGTGGFGGFGFTGTPGVGGFSNGNVTGAIIVIGAGGVPFLSGIFGAGGPGGDGGPIGNPNGRAGQPGFVLALEIS
jgi:hypothetical protein